MIEGKPGAPIMDAARIKIEVDGESLEAAAGQTLLEALRGKVKLPSLCGERLEGLSYPCPSCGLPAVEITGTARVVLACRLMAANGLSVKTFSPAIRRARLLALKELVNKHPGHCNVCQRNGLCRLQTLCADLGLAVAVRPNPDPVLTLVSMPGPFPAAKSPQMEASLRLVGLGT
jgi:NADH dehydrogenase/NADH:ubiquinone oxidoreductase subunit G